MTRAKRAWCKGNAYLKAGQHAKAVYWLSQTVEILDGERRPRRRPDGLDSGYLLTAFAAFVLIVVASLTT
jgi:hypothetical protein